MKRSSSVAAIADPEGETKWNWQDDVLATSMRLVAIEEEDSSCFSQRNTMKKNDNESMGSIASSRCSSGGSLQGWGTTASRKSYKRDLSSLASLEDHGVPSTSTSSKQSSSNKDTSRYPPTSVNSDVDKDYSYNAASSADGADSWGFFVDSAF